VTQTPAVAAHSKTHQD